MVLVVTNDKVQMGKKVSPAISHQFAGHHVFIHNITDVTPHWKIFDKHFKKVGVVDSILQFLQILGYEVHFTQQTPINAIIVGNFVGRGFTSIPNERFTGSHFYFLTSLNLVTLEIVTKFDILIYSCLGFYFVRRVLFAERKTVVSVRLRRIVVRSFVVIALVKGKRNSSSKD